MTTAPDPDVRSAPLAPHVNALGEKLARVRRLQREPLNYMLSVREEFGDIAYFEMGMLRSLMITHPDMIHEVLVEKSRIFERARSQTQIISRLVGHSVLTTDGDYWKRQRKLMQPAFHHKRISTYAEGMVRHAARTAETWHAAGSAPRDVADDMMKLTLAVVAEALFGANVSDVAAKVGEAVERGQRAVTEQSFMMIPIPFWLPVPQNLQMRQAAKALDDVIMPIIAERRKAASDTGDLLSMLLLAAEGGESMTDAQVRSEAMTMFVAGHETTANALGWTWYLLAQHPDAEAALHAELDSVLGGRLPTLDDLSRLPYTEMVVKEAMRLYPPAWIITRAARQHTTVAGFRCPRGTIVVMSPYVVHRDPRFFPEPEAFRPERWAAGNAEKLPRDAYMPFGDGPHICIGNAFAMMEARLILAALASRFRVRLADGFRAEVQPLITLRPRAGIMGRVEARG